MRPFGVLQVTAKVLCAAAGPWGLVSTIEGIMAQQAQASVQSFLEFCSQKCKQDTQQLPGYTSDAETVEFYQDAADTFLGAYPPSAELAGAIRPDPVTQPCLSLLWMYIAIQPCKSCSAASQSFRRKITMSR